MKNSVNFLIVGVGGQGTILVSDILSEVGMLSGLDAKKSDIMGLAIRGGSVSSHVRWAEKVGSPMNMTGTVDYLMASEPLEALRSMEYLKKESTVIYNEYPLQPMLVSTGKAEYPDNATINAMLKKASAKIIHYDATEKAQEIGNVKVMNIVLLGTLSKLFPEIGPDVWETAIRNHVPTKLQELNIKAFHVGREI
jgi:indolepyruvate ferredoxin oxidoreductase beta subunit